MAIKKKYQALGRGLDALISTEEVKTGGSSSISEVRIELIHPNPNQPRREFDDDSLQELANSIRQIGIIQPITLRDTGDGSYTIIAGERRWKASQRAGLEKIPALAYQHLTEQYGLTQEKLSERVGKNRATVTNYLRLLKLPATIQVALKNKDIDMGHARALLSLNDPTAQLKVFAEIKKQKLSVRKVEEMVKELAEGGTIRGKEGKRIRQKGSTLNADFNSLQNSLCRFFQTKVKLTCSNSGKGKISIPFSNEEELTRIMELFDQLKN